MTPPRWTTLLLRLLAPREQVEDVLGDLEEAHHRRLSRHTARAARVLTAFEALDMAGALVRGRIDRFRIIRGSSMLQDYKLAFRMLLKYPGLTLAGGLALAIAIGLGAGWYDLSGDLFRPTLPLPGGDRIVEVEMRDTARSADERRILHDFLAWRGQARTLQDLGAYRTLERNLVFGDERSAPLRAAETTAAAFRVAPVAPLLGRVLLEADERPGAPPVVVIGYSVWKERFAGSRDAVGRSVQLGRARATVIGVMPEGFAFPINHQLWIPLRLEAAGYEPLEGPPVRVFGRLATGATQAQANVEISALVDRTRTDSPGTHQHLGPRVLAYGGESPGDRTLLEISIRHLPILLVLVIACANVGTLVYARTATREAEIATRYALGASRGRIIVQLFVEALVLSSIAAVVGLGSAQWALKRGFAMYQAAGGSAPFWLDPQLEPATVLYAVGLTVLGAAILGVLPAIKATGAHAHAQLRELGAGRSTLRFGSFWTIVMIGQVALTVICIPPAFGISEESFRDRRIRGQFPADEYLAARLGLDQERNASGQQESPAEFGARFERTYRELERRIRQEPGVRAVTFGTRLPGMDVTIGGAEVEVRRGAAPVRVPTLWRTGTGPGFFEAFDRAIVTGRGFHDGDRLADARTVIVNEAFARRYTNGASPVGLRVRDESADPSHPEPWLEIVGMVQDMNMQPTDLGEAVYMYRPVAPATAAPFVLGVRTAGDPAAFAPRLREIAADLDPGLRLDELATLEDLAWRDDLPQMIVAGAIVSIVALGMFMSAAGIFALMSVTVARRTREIGLRTALGASPARLLTGIFMRAALLVGSGVAVGSLVIGLFAYLNGVDLTAIGNALLATSGVMIIVGLLACAEPARRALRIQPADALKDA
jgi:predicted permease